MLINDKIHLFKPSGNVMFINSNFIIRRISVRQFINAERKAKHNHAYTHTFNGEDIMQNSIIYNLFVDALFMLNVGVKDHLSLKSSEFLTFDRICWLVAKQAFFRKSEYIELKEEKINFEQFSWNIAGILT